MNKIVALILMTMVFTSSDYSGSTLAPVTLAGAVIKSKHVDHNTKKYKRKDCPVCKGKGWYISGDGIQKVECGYCESDDGDSGVLPEEPIEPEQPKTLKPAPRTKIFKR